MQFPPELLLDDPDFDLRMDIGVEADRDSIDTQRADWLVQVDLALLDVEALTFELMGDVGRGHRSEQLAFVSDARREGE